MTSGSGGDSGGNGLRFHVYVSSGKGKAVTALAGDPTGGTLERIGEAGLPGNGLPVAVSPDRRFLYASVRGEADGAEVPLYATFRIDQRDGNLSHLATVRAPARMAHVRVDNGGRFLLGASYFSSLVAANPIGPRGFVAAEPAQVLPMIKNAHQIMPDASNRFLLVPNLGADVVAQLRFDAATGEMTPNDPPAVYTATGAGPRHVAFHPNGRYVYLLNELDGSLNSYGFDPRCGTLTAMATTSVLPDGFDDKPWGAQIHVAPNGRFLFASERRSSTLASFRVDSLTGRLTGVAKIATEAQPRGFDIDPTGRFLVIAGEQSNHVLTYEIDQDSGELTPGARIEVAPGPGWVEIVDVV